MVEGGFIELALELIGYVFGTIFGEPKAVTRVESVPSDFTPREREMVAAIRARRNVSAKTAEDMVRWMRTQNSASDDYLKL